MQLPGKLAFLKFLRALTNHSVQTDPLALIDLKMLSNNLVSKPEYAEKATDNFWRKTPPGRYLCSEISPLRVWDKVQARGMVRRRRNHACFDEEAFEIPPQA